MKYLADTNVLPQRDSPKIRTWLIQHFLEVGPSSITAAEVAQGIEALPPGPKRARLEREFREMLQDFEILDFGLKEARAWGRYVSGASRPLPIMDSLIAAVALANGLDVVTENGADFPGVTTVNPAA